MLTAARSPWHEHRCLGPYVFYDVADGYALGWGVEGGATHPTHILLVAPLSARTPLTPPSLTAFRYAEESDKSWSNTLEAQLALCIVRCLLERFPDQLNPASIGIIAPYNGQARRLCLCLWLRFRRG